MIRKAEAKELINDLFEEELPGHLNGDATAPGQAWPSSDVPAVVSTGLSNTPRIGSHSNGRCKRRTRRIARSSSGHTARGRGFSTY